MDNNYVYEKPADEKLYEEMKRRSLEGKPVERKRKRIKINKKKFIRSMAVLLTVTVGITLAGHHIDDNMKESIQENALYGDMLEEYMEDVFYPSMHHIDGTTNDYYIDYDMLGNYIDESEDKALAVSLTENAIEAKNLTDDESQMDKILAETNLGVNSIDEFIRNQSSEYDGYGDKKQFIKDTRVFTEAQQSELEEMQEVEKTVDTGGKSL